MFNNVKDFLPNVKMESPPTPESSPVSRPSLDIKEKKKKPLKSKDIFLYSHNNKMESNSTDNVKIVSAETIEKEAKQEAEAKPAEDASPKTEAEPKSPNRRLGDRGRDKKVRKKRYPNGMPEERKAQLAKAREKALRVRKERALQRKAEKKREMNERYNHPAPAPKPKPQVQQRPVSQPIPIPQRSTQPKASKEQATEAFFGLMDRWDERRQERKKKRSRSKTEAEAKANSSSYTTSTYYIW